MKKCTDCNQVKPLDDFAPHKGRKDGVQSRCRLCYAVYQKEYYRYRVATDEEYRRRKKNWRAKRSAEKRRAQAIKVLDYLETHPCIDCGETDPLVLDFDHRDPSTKSFNIGEKLTSEANWELVEAEINKCDVRCANCHRRKTAKEGNFLRYQLTTGRGQVW